MDLRRANTPEPLNMTWAGEHSEHFCSFQSPEMFFLLTLPFIERAIQTSGISGGVFNPALAAGISMMVGEYLDLLCSPVCPLGRGCNVLQDGDPKTTSTKSQCVSPELLERPARESRYLSRERPVEME
jgi:hypothetical protein